ncbi:hypothetical protein SUDANB96_06617 [Streptomyces sp. enrichment culture]
MPPDAPWSSLETRTLASVNESMDAVLSTCTALARPDPAEAHTARARPRPDAVPPVQRIVTVDHDDNGLLCR